MLASVAGLLAFMADVFYFSGKNFGKAESAGLKFIKYCGERMVDSLSGKGNTFYLKKLGSRVISNPEKSQFIVNTRFEMYDKNTSEQQLGHLDINQRVKDVSGDSLFKLEINSYVMSQAEYDKLGETIELTIPDNSKIDPDSLYSRGENLKVKNENQLLFMVIIVKMLGVQFIIIISSRIHCYILNVKKCRDGIYI